MMLIIFIITLLVLVLVHEAGHFAMARVFRVAIAEFSIGFGPALWKYTDSKQQTQFKIAPILLGGYVKFFEENPPPTAGRLYQELNLSQKILILLAGPAANLIFAFLALIVLFKLSSFSFLPWIGDVNAAASAKGFARGQKIIQINHQDVRSWEDIAHLLGVMSVKASIELEDPKYGRKMIVVNVDELPALRLSPFIPELPAKIATVRAHSPAALAGLEPGDHIISVNQQPIHSFPQLAQYLQTHRQQDLLLLVRRQQQMLRFKIQAHGTLGIYTYPFSHYPKWFYYHQHAWSEAIPKAYRYFWQLCWIQINVWFHLPQEVHHLSSPVGIAKTAMESWSMGFKTFLQFLVWLSIGLAVVNLLPIPILDGGQCLLLLLQHGFPKFWNTRRQQYLIIWSIFFLLGLFGVGLFNDLSF